jgi:hypothetical protein
VKLRLSELDVARGLSVTPEDVPSLLSNGRFVSWIAKLWLKEPKPGRVRILTKRGVSFCQQAELGTQRSRRPDADTYAFLRPLGYMWVVDLRRIPEVTMTRLNIEDVIAALSRAGRTANVSGEEFDRLFRPGLFEAEAA